MTYNWGILGCGKIAKKFVKGLNLLPDATVIAAASKDPVKLKKFIKKTKIKKKYNTYQELVNDNEVDIIYIATTHNFHYENIFLALQNSKHVLCEKPLVINSIQAEQLIKLAKQKKLFLMEAMWMRFIPTIRKLNELISNKTVGNIKSIKADFCIPFLGNKNSRLMDPLLCGGALLDLGVYTISFAQMIFKQTPQQIESKVKIGKTGVDEFAQYSLIYENEKKANLSSGFKNITSNTAILYGTNGTIIIKNFISPKKITIKDKTNRITKIKLPYKKPGLQYQAQEMMENLNKGTLNCQIMPLEETLSVIKIMDKLRFDWNLKYPADKNIVTF